MSTDLVNVDRILPATTTPQNSLKSLPYNVIVLIFRFLPSDDLWHITQVCFLFRAIALDDYFWRKLFFVDFYRKDQLSKGLSFWYQQYWKKKKSKALQQNLVPIDVNNNENLTPLIGCSSRDDDNLLPGVKCCLSENVYDVETPKVPAKRKPSNALLFRVESIQKKMSPVPVKKPSPKGRRRKDVRQKLNNVQQALKWIVNKVTPFKSQKEENL